LKNRLTMNVTGNAPSANKAEWTTLSASQNGIAPMREPGIDESDVKAVAQTTNAIQGVAARTIDVEFTRSRAKQL